MTLFTNMAIVAAALLPAAALAQNQSFKDVVKKVEAKIEPVSAKRGETVKWTLTVELIEGWHTYPTTQVDPNASSYVNKFKFPRDDNVVFVGTLVFNQWIASPKAVAVGALCVKSAQPVLMEWCYCPCRPLSLSLLSISPQAIKQSRLWASS